MTTSLGIGRLFLFIPLLVGLGGLGTAWGAEPLVVKKEVVLETFPEKELPHSSATAGNGERETLDVPVVSWRDMPFRTVKKQALDYSCGSAAVSTLLTYVYGAQTAEGTIFKAMFDSGDQNKIRREGFSLLDMSNYLNKRGFKAVGYKASLSSIEKHKVPFIALVNDSGYNHFVVVKSVKGPHVLIGDPNKGNVILARSAFEKMWNGIALVVTNHAQKARAIFEGEAEWRYAHPMAGVSDADYVGIDSTVLPSLQWQIAPARIDMLNAVNQTAANLYQQLGPAVLSGTGGVP